VLTILKKQFCFFCDISLIKLLKTVICLHVAVFGKIIRPTTPNALIYSIPATPPWLLKQPHINYNIHYSSKDNTSPEIYRNKFFEFCDHYKDFSQLYTDVARWCNGKAFGLAISRSQVQILQRQRCVTTLGKLFTPMCLCHQAV